MYQVVIIKSGRMGKVVFHPGRTVIGPFETRREAVEAAAKRYRMAANPPRPELAPDKLEGTPEDFTTISKGDGMDFTDHTFIEEI